MNVPNTITLARLAAVPILVWLILVNDLQIAFWVFLAAALSDAIDGIIAKHFNRMIFITNLKASISH